MNIYHDWKESTNQWVYQYKTEYNYDANENMTFYIWYNWNNATSQWVNASKIECSYDFAYDLTNLILPIFDSFFPQCYNMLTNWIRSSWSITNSQWVESDKNSYYYSEVVIGIYEIPKSSISLFPNPVSEKLHISNIAGSVINKLNIYNQIGQKVLHENYPNNLIDVSMLHVGIYLIELVSDNWIFREKLIIK